MAYIENSDSIVVKTDVIVQTPGIAMLCENPNMMAWVAVCLSRHLHGDWGDDMYEEDIEMNNDALKTKDDILSVYEKGDVKIYIKTDDSWHVTTILLPSEY